MAKSSSARGGSARSHNSIANSRRDPLSVLLSPQVYPSRVVSAVSDYTGVNLLDDRRLWHPDPEQGTLTIGGKWARVVVHPRPFVARTKPPWAWKGLPTSFQVPVGLKYESPLNVVKCVRRKMRRSVIFALNKQGKGAKSQYRRRDAYSGVKC